MIPKSRSLFSGRKMGKRGQIAIPAAIITVIGFFLGLLLLGVIGYMSYGVEYEISDTWNTSLWDSDDQTSYASLDSEIGDGRDLGAKAAKVFIVGLFISFIMMAVGGIAYVRSR